MRVLHLLSSTGFHGAENMAAVLVRRLAANGVQNHVGVLRSYGDSNLQILDAVRDIAHGHVFECRGRFDWRVIGALRRYIRWHDVDVVHSHKYKTNFYAVIAGLGLGRTLISTCHNWLGTSSKMRLYAALDKRVLAVFDKVVGVSDEVADELRRHVAARKVEKIDNGIDIDRFDPLPAPADAKRALGVGDRPVIGFVGRLTNDKAVSVLLRAVHKLGRRRPVKLLVIGDGKDSAALKQEAQALGVHDSVEFLGHRTDTPRLYPALDVFVLPSRKEAFPMVVLEAMACAVPVIATRVGDVPYILQYGACGRLVDVDDVDGLCRALDSVLSDPIAAQQLGAAGQQRVHERFSSQIMARHYQALYAQSLQQRAEQA